MSENALPKGYEPHAVEDHWREYWEKNKTFTPDPDAPGEPFSIVIPPPNVTGALHIGHALNHTLIDVLCRHARQKGKKVLWLPGTDHAGIATQNVVERALAKEGKTRHDLGREAFVERVWQWKEDYGNRILNQIRMLGDSVDWTRERFTMDEGLSKAVRKVFVELYKEGYIYKGKYIINWCCRCHTALADDEVDHMPEKGHLYHVRYVFEDGSGSVIIATTPPETIMADTGVCVHPEDERYAGLVGKKIVVPVIGRVVPLFADRYVDKEFGTGALKVTPCHDPNDWTLGERHGLEFIQCIDEDGNMTVEAGPYAGLSKEECRKRIVEDLQASGQLVKIEDLDHSVGHCYRCKTVVEPHMSEQWFVASTKLAPRARAAVPEMTQIFPENWMKTYYNWLDNIRDWCISRQLWWGHQIPAWYCDDCGETVVAKSAPCACPKCGSAKLTQDPDTLDTWFSSALWPFSTLGWPNEESEDLKYFYPTNTLVTGYDIIGFWVSRMIFSGLAYTGKAPFDTVCIHGIVRDSQGRKMSKSLGNGIDPLEVIAQYGADALRFMLVDGSTPGNDMRYIEKKVEAARYFANKLWNATRFVLMNLPEDLEPGLPSEELLDMSDKWVLTKLNQVAGAMTDNLDHYEMGLAAAKINSFIWDVYCDWFIEIAKPRLNSGDAQQADTARRVLVYVLDKALKLLHPFMPFITEELYQALPGSAETIMTQAWPTFDAAHNWAADEEAFEKVMDYIKAVRTMRTEMNVHPAKKTSMIIETADAAPFQNAQVYLAKFAFATDVTFTEKYEGSTDGMVQVSTHAARGFIPIMELIDREKELARLNKEKAKAEKEMAMFGNQLNNPKFVERAPAALVEEIRTKFAKSQDKLANIEQSIKALG